MIRACFVLLSPAIVALAACAPADDDKDGAGPTTPSLLPSYELAVAGNATKRDYAAQPVGEASPLVELTPAELNDQMASGEIMVVDVRTSEEIAQGMIPGAVHIALDEFEPGPALLERADGREIVLYCRSGRRSGIAGRKLSDFLDKPVSHLGDGFVGWQAQGLPVSLP